MNDRTRCLASTAIATITIAGAAIAHAADEDDASQPNSYLVTRLVSDLAGAAHQDLVLQNSWGVAFTPAGSPFWINDNNTGCATLYDGTGVKVTTLQVSIPLPGNAGVPNTDCKSAKPPPTPTPAAPTAPVCDSPVRAACF